MTRTLLLWSASALALALGLQRYAVAPALFLALVGLLRLAREAPSPFQAWVRVASAFAAAALAVVDNTYLNAPTSVRLGVDLVAGAVSALPFVLHRALQPRLPAGLAWLVLPCAQALLEAATALGPYGSWGAVAYSLRDWTAVLQLASLGGPGLVAFWICAAAAGLEASLRPGQEGRRSPFVLAAAAGVALAPVAWGAWRLRGPEPGPRVKVAAVSLSDATYAALVEGRSMKALAQAPPGVRAQAAPAFSAAHAQLLGLTEQALDQGARLVVWPETVPTLEEQLPALESRAREMAAARGAGILLTPWVVRRSPVHPYGENLALGIDGSGTLFRFRKAHPVPGVERNILPGQAPPAAWASPAGPAAAAICMDLDFPAYLRRIPPGTGLLLAPADDWPALREVHPAMHRLRAVELGASLVRAANNGISELVDPRGRVVARLDNPSGGLLLGELPVPGRSTFHARAGGWVEALCAAILAALGLHALRSPRP